ncbi:four helix bundle protein [Thioalbus denitrificans]|nr:four helix bundle protein [Thioalbus denitrificans]
MRRKHHDLRAWRSAMALVGDVYRLTASFPASEQFGLTSQLRRAAVSVPSNIAEGAARLTRKEFLHFAGMARGSLSELETQLLIAHDLGFISENEDLSAQLDELFGLLGGLINSLRDKN